MVVTQIHTVNTDVNHECRLGTGISYIRLAEQEFWGFGDHALSEHQEETEDLLLRLVFKAFKGCT